MPQTGLDMLAKSFREWIYNQDNMERIRNYQKYSDYYDGEFDFHVPERIKAALGSDFKVVANYARTIVDKAVGYLCGKPIGVQVIADVSEVENPEEKIRLRKEAKQVERLLNIIYRDNNFMKQNILKLMRIQGKKGDVFIKCFIDPNDKMVPIKMRVLKPDIVFPKFKDDDAESYEYIPIVIDRIDERGQPYKYAQVFWDDVIIEYVQKMGESDWVEVDRHPNEIGMIPIIHIKNNEDDLPWGTSDIYPIMSLVDAICKALTDLTCNADYQAFQRVITTGHSEEIPEDGTPTKRETGPGVMHNIPEPDANIHVVDPVDPTGLIEIIKTLRQEISTHSRVPQISLSQADGGGAASSLALRIHYQPLDEKCNEKATIAANGLQRLNDIIFAYHKLLTREDYTNYQTEVRFNPDMPSDRVEEETIRDTQIRNKIKSRETAMEEIGIEDPDIERDKIKAEMEAYETDIYSSRVGEDIDNLLGNKDGNGGGAEE